jgi:hypothetical protein
MADGIFDTQPPLFTNDMDEQPFSTVFSAGIIQSFCGFIMIILPEMCANYAGYASFNDNTGEMVPYSTKEVELLRLFATVLFADGISMIYTSRCGSMSSMQGFVYQRLIVAGILVVGCLIGWFDSVCIKCIVAPFAIGALYTMRSCYVHYDEKDEEHSFASDFTTMFNFYDEF